MDLIFYCDESCHIQFDNVEYMSLVAIFCSKSRAKKINRIRKIKEKLCVCKYFFEIKCI